MKLKLTVRGKRKAAVRPLTPPRPVAGRPRVVGLGEFSTGVPDLGSNKKHLQGFGS